MTSKTALVTGASGLLGRRVLRHFYLNGWNAIGTGLSRVNPPEIVKLDLLDTVAIERLLDEIKPHVVIHCAANRFPDSCNANPQAAHDLNVAATRALASATSSRGILLIYISTDYVFSGLPGEAPYKPPSATNPPNVYGQTKLDGEKAVLEETSRKRAHNVTEPHPPPVLGVVLRVPVLYGPGEPSESAVNVLMEQVWQAQSIKATDEKIKVDDYAQRFPTNTEDVARVCFKISELYLGTSAAADLPRILHFSSEDKMTKWDICKLFGEILGLPLDGMEPFKPEDQNSNVKRPYDCHLDTSDLQSLGIDTHTTDFKSWWQVQNQPTSPFSKYFDKVKEERNPRLPALVEDGLEKVLEFISKLPSHLEATMEETEGKPYGSLISVVVRNYSGVLSFLKRLFTTP